MSEATQIRDAVLEALQDADLEAILPFPDGMALRRSGAVAVVGVRTVEGKNLAFCNYLGETYDEEQGTYREIYGKQLDAEISVDIRAAGAADCEAACETAAEVLLGALPAGITPGELRWEGLNWERATEQFLRKGTLRCRAVFVADGTEEEPEFLHFTLKGVLTA